MHVLPFPAFALLAPLQFDFLHAIDKLVGNVAVSSCLLEVFVVQLSTLFEEKDNPACVKRCAQEEDKEDTEIIDCKDDTEDEKSEEREQQTQTARCEKLFYTSMVFNAL